MRFSQTFDALLTSIVERASASGPVLDKGLEDVVADELDVLSEKVLRTDTVTGAQTRLVRFALKTRAAITSPDEALHMGTLIWIPSAVERCVNARSGRAAIVVRGLTTTDDADRLVKAVRLIRPSQQGVTAETDPCRIRLAHRRCRDLAGGVGGGGAIGRSFPHPGGPL